MSKRAQTTILASVRLELPPGANTKAAVDYVRSAVRSWCGGLDPEDPMFDLERNSVKVALLQKLERVEYTPGRPANKKGSA